MSAQVSIRIRYVYAMCRSGNCVKFSIHSPAGICQFVKLA